MTRAARHVLADLSGATGWKTADPSRLKITASAAAIASPLPISDCAAGAYGALALAAAELSAARNGPRLTPQVNRRHAGLACTGHSYLTVSGETPETWGQITGYYECKTGGHVYLHGIFPHLRDGLLSLFDAEDTRTSMAHRLAQMDANEVEASAQAHGLCAIRQRSRAEWAAHPQAAALARLPVIARGGGGVTASPLPPLTNTAGTRPLSGLRVLDLSRVIAGPMAGRALAELGADVLRIFGPGLPFIEPLVIDTGFGKRATQIDLKSDAGRNTLRTLVRDADVMIDGYRPGALSALGFGAEALHALNPGLTLVRISAFGGIGPWGMQRGYDTYVQAATGFTLPERPGDQPTRLPCQPLDYLSGCLGAFAATLGLLGRTAGRGGCVFDISLARTAMWLWQMQDEVGPEPSPPGRNPSLAEITAEGMIRALETPFGPVTALAPPYGFAEDDLSWAPPPALPNSTRP